MSRAPRKSAITGGRTVGVPRFAGNLYRMRMEKGLSQSDLARLVWGTTVDGRGYTVAKNKDRISRWEQGSQVPEPQNLQAVADALGVSVETLAPDLVGRKIDADQNPAVHMTMVQGQPGRVHLVVDTLTSLDVASKIIALLSADPLVSATA